EIGITRIPFYDLPWGTGPTNTESRIVPTHARRQRRIVKIRHHVEHDTIVGESKEAVRTAGRNVERARRICQLDGDVLQIRPRARTQVESHVIYPPGKAPN